MPVSCCHLEHAVVMFNTYHGPTRHPVVDAHILAQIVSTIHPHHHRGQCQGDQRPGNGNHDMTAGVTGVEARDHSVDVGHLEMMPAT